MIRSFILPVGITKISLTATKIVQITETHQVLPIISLIYIEEYVSFHNHHHNIKRAKEREIDLILIGIIFFIFDNVFLDIECYFNYYNATIL